MLSEQEQAWRDATDDADPDAVRSVDNAEENLDERMLCDIQSLADGLVAKAEKLLGNFTNDCAKAGCTFGPSFTVESR